MGRYCWLVSFWRSDVGSQNLQEDAEGSFGGVKKEMIFTGTPHQQAIIAKRLQELRYFNRTGKLPGPGLRVQLPKGCVPEIGSSEFRHHKEITEEKLHEYLEEIFFDRYERAFVRDVLKDTGVVKSDEGS